MAVEQLQRCGQAAEKMATESAQLAIKFQQIANDSQDAAATAINDKVKDQEAKKVLLQKLHSTIAFVAGTKKL